MGHAEVRRCALDGEALSNRVSSRLQIPNGFDGAEHARFRAATDPFLEASRVAAMRATFGAIASDLVASLRRGSAVDAVWQIGAPLAVRCQSAWLGWPADLEPTLLEWIHDHRAAMRGSERRWRAAAVAERFDALVLDQLRSRRARPGAEDVTTELIHTSVEDPAAPRGWRALRDHEVVSILRNWTAGDLGTIATCFGVVAHRIATDGSLQHSLRAAIDEFDALERAIDECLRIDDPFLWNRRVATRDTHVAGRTISAGSKVVVNWTAANRDPRCFGRPDAFRPDENAAHNLVYGVGPHACPGRALATLQLREALCALLRAVPEVRLAPRAPTRARAPSGGYEHVWIVL